MSSVDFFAVGGVVESNRWVEVSRKVLYLDRDDFLPNGYKISAKFKNLVLSTARSTGGPWLTRRLCQSDRS